jgi:hypothetical protein
LDELCHFAQDEDKGGRSLVVNIIILNETKDNNKGKINKFFGGTAGVQKAVGPLVTLSLIFPLIFFEVNNFLMYQVSGSWSLCYVSANALDLVILLIIHPVLSSNLQ